MVLVYIGVAVKCTMYQRKVDVDIAERHKEGAG